MGGRGGEQNGDMFFGLLAFNIFVFNTSNPESFRYGDWILRSNISFTKNINKSI